MTMFRWNSINPIVERTAGRVARAHLRNAVEAAGLAGNENETLVANGRIVGCSDIVASIYGITREDALDLTTRGISGSDVEPK